MFSLVCVILFTWVRGGSVHEPPDPPQGDPPSPHTGLYRASPQTGWLTPPQDRIGPQKGRPASLSAIPHPSQTRSGLASLNRNRGPWPVFPFNVNGRLSCFNLTLVSKYFLDFIEIFKLHFLSLSCVSKSRNPMLHPSHLISLTFTKFLFKQWIASSLMVEVYTISNKSYTSASSSYC